MLTLGETVALVVFLLEHVVARLAGRLVQKGAAPESEARLKPKRRIKKRTQPKTSRPPQI